MGVLVRCDSGSTITTTYPAYLVSVFSYIVFLCTHAGNRLERREQDDSRLRIGHAILALRELSTNISFELLSSFFHNPSVGSDVRPEFPNPYPINCYIQFMFTKQGVNPGKPTEHSSLLDVFLPLLLHMHHGTSPSAHLICFCVESGVDSCRHRVRIKIYTWVYKAIKLDDRNQLEQKIIVQGFI